MNLKNKVVVITGGSRGLGKALAAAFVAEGAKVVVTARSKKELFLTGKEIGAVTFLADMTKEKDVKALASFTRKKFKKIDIWINNAGIWLPHSSIEGINVKQAHKVMEINFFGTFYGSREAFLIMKKQKTRGMIVNIISTSSLIARPRSQIYAASKWATRGFTYSICEAFKEVNIPVIAVHPGAINTTIFGKMAPVSIQNFMEPSYVANKIVKNLKLKKPKNEVIIEKK